MTTALRGQNLDLSDESGAGVWTSDPLDDSRHKRTRPGRARASGCILVINANSCYEVECSGGAAPFRGSVDLGLATLLVADAGLTGRGWSTTESCAST